MDDVIMIGALLGTLAFIVFAVYCCLIHNAKQGEISQKDWEEFEKSENKNWEE